MDQPGLDARKHRAALRGLARINAVSKSADTLWAAVARSDSPPAGLKVLDVACGGGDVSVGLWRRAQRSGAAISVTAVDVSPTAVEATTAAACKAGAAVEAVRLDVLREPLPRGFDVAVSSLFLHHLSREEAVLVLRKMAEAAPRVIVSDLERSRSGYWLAVAGTRVLSTSPVVHVDGPLSVRAAFSIGELRRVAEEAGLTGAAVRKCWPSRLLLEWGRP